MLELEFNVLNCFLLKSNWLHVFSNIYVICMQSSRHTYFDCVLSFFQYICLCIYVFACVLTHHDILNKKMNHLYGSTVLCLPCRKFVIQLWYINIRKYKGKKKRKVIDIVINMCMYVHVCMRNIYYIYAYIYTCVYVYIW